MISGGLMFSKRTVSVMNNGSSNKRQPTGKEQAKGG